MIINQISSFLLYIILGLSFGLILDIFRSLRRSITTSNYLTYIEDIVFLILIGCIFILTVTTFNLGEIRLYTFTGILIGFTIYFLYFSKHIIKLNVGLLNMLINLFRKIYNIIILRLIKTAKSNIIRIKKNNLNIKLKNIRKKEGF